MRKHLSLAAAIAAISASYTTPGIAQTQQAVLEEVVVTARKRSETLQDVPFSIAAKTEGQLRRSGATNLETMADGVAGLAVQNLGPGQSQVAIRGISAGQIVRDQPGVKEQVGVYLDESVISLSLFTPDLDFYDTNRVEVLRGPQGTLFGSGSLAGTIRYISNEPDLEEDSGSLTTTVQHVKDGEVGGSLKGHTNVVLGERAALRAVAYTEQFAGYIDAIQPNGGEEEDVNSGEKHGVRIALKFQPTENVTLTPRVVWQDIDMDGFNREDHYNVLANPFTTTRPAITLGEREQYTQLEENFEDEFLLVDFDATVNLDEMVFTSITSWTDREVIVERDATALTAFFNSGDSNGESIYALSATLADTTDVEMITQEFRLASDNDSALQWVAGVFYTQIDRDYAQSLMVPGYEPTGDRKANSTNKKYAQTDELYYSDIPYQLTQAALFGEMSYDLTSRLNMTVGARFFDFDEDREVVINGQFGGLTERKEDTESSGISPRLLVRYDLNDDVMLNAQVAKGFRLGGINDPINTNLCTPADAATFGGFNEFDDEEVINYEVGAKTTAFGGRGTFNVSAFYSDIENLQATLDAGTCSSRIVYNVEEAHSQGIEIEITARPTDSWEVSVAASYIDAELDSTVTSTDASGNVTILGGIEDGNELPTAPDYSVALVSTNYFQWNQDWEGYFTAAFQSVGARYTQIVDQTDGAETIDVSGGNSVGNSTATTINFDQELDNYQTVNLRLGGRTANWDLALFVNNATDENIYQSVDREAGGAARIGYRVGQPRTAGITARYDF